MLAFLKMNNYTLNLFAIAVNKQNLINYIAPSKVCITFDIHRILHSLYIRDFVYKWFLKVPTGYRMVLAIL